MENQKSAIIRGWNLLPSERGDIVILCQGSKTVNWKPDSVGYESKTLHSQEVTFGHCNVQGSEASPVISLLVARFRVVVVGSDRL